MAECVSVYISTPLHLEAVSLTVQLLVPLPVLLVPLPVLVMLGFLSSRAEIGDFVRYFPTS